MDTQKAKEKVRRMIESLEELYALLDSDAPRWPPEAAEQADRGLCLFCKEPITPKQKKTAQRQNHAKCYRRNKRAVEAGEATDRGLVESGLWAPVKKPGRKRIRPKTLPQHGALENED